MSTGLRRADRRAAAGDPAGARADAQVDAKAGAPPRAARRAAPRATAEAAAGMVVEEFLDIVGHELRIPMTSIKGQLQLMRRRRERMGDNAEALRVEQLLYHTERLNYLLQVALDAAHIMEGTIQLLPAEEEYDLADVIGHVTRLFAAGNSAVTFAIESAESARPLLGNWDRLRVETVLSVLLANALKFGGGRITVRTATGASNNALVEVTDQGIGVPPRERRRIFEPYTHGSNAESSGPGLGLHVARAIVRAHHGRIGARARRGGGSAFWFTLPLVRLPTLSESVPVAAGARRAAVRRAPRG